MTVVRNTTTSAQNEDLSRGEPVEVTLVGDEQAERVVWEVEGDLVYVCSQKTFERLQRGDQAALPIGFPISDVRALAA